MNKLTASDKPMLEALLADWNKSWKGLIAEPDFDIVQIVTWAEQFDECTIHRGIDVTKDWLFRMVVKVVPLEADTPSFNDAVRYATAVMRNVDRVRRKAKQLGLLEVGGVR
jgi:hypothetical protein